MDFSRRSFLRTTSVSASALFLGLPLLEGVALGHRFADPTLSSNEDFLALFQERMKKENKPGMIIVIPKDPTKESQVRRALTAVFQSGDLGLFTQAIFVCLRRSKAGKVAKDLKDDVCLIPVDVEGKPADAQTIDIEKLADEFVKRSHVILFGEKSEKLAGIIQAQEKTLGADKTKQLRQALEELDAEEFGRRDRAAAELAEMASWAPALIYQEYLKATTAERRKRLSVVITGMTNCPKNKQSDPLLPYGVSWVEDHAPCPTCSRSSADPNVHRYLRFVIGK